MYDVFRICYLFESAFEGKCGMKSFDDAELTACVLSKIDKNTITIKQDIQRKSVLLTASSKCCLDRAASNISDVGKITEKFLPHFPVDRQNRVRVFQGPPKVFRGF
jgi:hypothetical protein